MQESQPQSGEAEPTQAGGASFLGWGGELELEKTD